MAPAMSKEEAEQKELKAKKVDALVRNICISSAFSVCQHFIFAQSEPRLFVSLCGNNTPRATRLLGNTSGIVGLISLVLNQAGGKLSDSIGRRPGFLVGPLCNILLGLLVFSNPRNLPLVTICRMLRLTVTTFSNTVMCNAALGDICSQEEFKLAQSKIQVATGVAMLATPFVEERLLSFSPTSPNAIKYVYLVMSSIAAMQATFVTTQIEETLDKAKRTVAKFDWQCVNPFGFLRIFSEGSKALQKVVTIVTLQMFLEGKNLSDVVMAWTRDKLKWSVAGTRNFIFCYGALCLVAGKTVTPHMLKTLKNKEFTTVNNLLNIGAFSLRGAAPSTALWLLMMFPMLPGVNGASSIALKGVAQKMADGHGFGNGEFSAWINNLRALAGAVAPVVYAQVYSAFAKRGMNPGHTFAVAGLLGALLPEILLRTTSDSEVETVSKK
eukprot:TRINITY_DN55730_c0_g1_i1.p1 TRINITY_DN55730_c0_g1~~TRINITY_DN55730_c0_g1_i1.p1  ORF type:complete len:440 (+),score=95.66 TRINITY_DN55730_c0_g1_i1:62-1381(+)